MTLIRTSVAALLVPTLLNGFAAAVLFALSQVVFAGSVESPSNPVVACLENPDCPAEKAKTIYQQALETGSPEVDCTWPYYGVLVDRDYGLAFKCFERAVEQEGKCKGHAWLERLFYASMLASGQGTEPAPKKVKDVFDGCSGDPNVGPVLAAAKKLEEDPNLSPYDYCRVNQGTTDMMGTCLTVLAERERVEGLLATKKLWSRLSPTQREKWKAAEAAWNDFAEKSARFYSAGGGSTGRTRYPAYVAEKQAERAAANATLFDYRPDKANHSKAFVMADKLLNERYGKAMKNAGEPDAPGLLRDAQRAWLVFRDAEIELHKNVFGKKYGDKVVELDVKMRLTRKRNRDLKPAGRPD